MKLTLTGYSTALFSTWYFVEELGLLFDAGDGVSAALLQKSRKVTHAFISHADRDHLTGLLQFNQLNARPGFPIIHYPKDCGSLAALGAFAKKFDAPVAATVWQPIQAGDVTWIREDTFVEAIRNGHVAAPPGVSKSLSFKVWQVKRKLKPELAALPAAEISRTVQELGKEATTVEVRTTLLGYSGDTPVEDAARWDYAGVLIHEATFLGGAEDAGLRAHGNRHSTLEAVMEMVSGLRLKSLVLGHFSSRYAPEQIDQKIRFLCDRYTLNVPVFRLLPGKTAYDVLNQTPING